MKMNKADMLAILKKIKRDIVNKEREYALNGMRVDVSLGNEEINYLIQVIEEYAE